MSMQLLSPPSLPPRQVLSSTPGPEPIQGAEDLSIIATALTVAQLQVRGQDLEVVSGQDSQSIVTLPLSATALQHVLGAQDLSIIPHCAHGGAAAGEIC